MTLYSYTIGSGRGMMLYSYTIGSGRGMMLYSYTIGSGQGMMLYSYTRKVVYFEIILNKKGNKNAVAILTITS